jgi:hypothetical protein
MKKTRMMRTAADAVAKMAIRRRRFLACRAALRAELRTDADGLSIGYRREYSPREFVLCLISSRMMMTVYVDMH